MDKLTLTQKKLAIAALGILFLFFCLWFGMHKPTLRKVVVLRLKLASLEHQLREIDIVTTGHENKEAGIRELEKKAELLDKQFLSDEEPGYKIISQLANQQGIEIVSLQPGTKSPLVDSSAAPVVVNRQACFKVPVILEIKGSYKNIVSFVDALEHAPLLLAVVDSFKMVKGEVKITATLNITLYLLS